MTRQFGDTSRTALYREGPARAAAATSSSSAHSAQSGPARHYAALAPHYDDVVYHAAPNWLATQARFVGLRMGLKPGHRFLDFGGGTGLFAAALRDQFGANPAVLEPSPEMARQAARQLGPNSVHLGTLADLAASSGKFDAVLLKECIHHLDAPEQTLQALQERHVRPGGRVCVVILRLEGDGVPAEVVRDESGLVPSNDQAATWLPNAPPASISSVAGPWLPATAWERRLRARAYSYLRAKTDRAIDKLVASTAGENPAVRERLTTIVWG